MTVGTAARNNSPSWFKISTDYLGASDHARPHYSPVNLRCTPLQQAILSRDKRVIL